MDEFTLTLILTFFSTLAASAIITRLVIYIARKLQLIAVPTSDRWHKSATPLMGGVAMFISFSL